MIKQAFQRKICFIDIYFAKTDSKSQLYYQEENETINLQKKKNNLCQDN